MTSRQAREWMAVIVGGSGAEGEGSLNTLRRIFFFGCWAGDHRIFQFRNEDMEVVLTR